jgi:hypothetical protein
MNKRVLLGLGSLVLVVLIAGGSFFAGTVVGGNQARQSMFQGRFGGQAGQFQRTDRTPQPGQPGQPGNLQPGQPGGGRQGGGTMGTIKTVEGDTIVVTTQDGDVQVHATDTTLIEKYTAVGVADLKEGERVVVSGSQNDDGSITARSIQSLRNPQTPQSQ